MALSQIGVIPHGCVKGTSAYEWEREIVQAALECIFDQHKVTSPQSFALNLPGHRADVITFTL